jgi:hypothetical protein
VDRCLRPAFLIRAPQRLAVDGNDARRQPREPRDPGDEATLELLRVERREDVVELIVRRRAILERPETMQQIELLIAEPGELDPAFKAASSRTSSSVKMIIFDFDSSLVMNTLQTLPYQFQEYYVYLLRNDRTHGGPSP